MDQERPDTVDCAAAAAEDAVGPSPRVGRKCDQVLDGARAVILARGFEGASVDDIAREAGVSKATMYRYYPDKAALFAAVMQRDCGRQAEALHGLQDGDRCLEALLTDLANLHVQLVLSPMAQGMFRTAAAEAERFPEVGQAFYAASIDRGRAWLAPILGAAADRGEIVCDDPDLAAQRFFALCEAGLFYKRLFGVMRSCCEATAARHAHSAVAAFLRMHRPDPPQSAAGA